MNEQIANLMTVLNSRDTSVDEVVEGLRKEFRESGHMTPDIEASFNDYRRALQDTKVQRDGAYAAIYNRNLSPDEAVLYAKLQQGDQFEVGRKVAQLNIEAEYVRDCWLRAAVKDVPAIVSAYARFLEDGAKLDAAAEDATPPAIGEAAQKLIAVVMQADHSVDELVEGMRANFQNAGELTAPVEAAIDVDLRRALETRRPWRDAALGHVFEEHLTDEEIEVFTAMQDPATVGLLAKMAETAGPEIAYVRGMWVNQAVAKVPVLHVGFLNLGRLFLQANVDFEVAPSAGIEVPGTPVVKPAVEYVPPPPADAPSTPYEP